MRLTLLLSLLLCSGLVQAQYRCEVNGKSVFSDVPCAHNAQYVGAMQDASNSSERIRQERQNMRDRSQIQSIEYQRQRDHYNQSRLIAETAAADRAAASARCSQARRTGSRVGMREDC